MTKGTLRAACAVIAMGAALFEPCPAVALPDLVPQITDIIVATADVSNADVLEGCAGARFNRRLVKFSLRTRNVGPDDLVLGDPGCPNCSLNPGAPCTNPLFQCGTAHGHAHFEGFAKNQILDSEGNIVVEGRKYGFCLLDLQCASPHYSCSYQGLTAGCSDVYSSGLPCQYVDITDADLPDGVYTLRSTVDPFNELAESDDGNNSIDMQFTIGGTDQICPAYASTDVPKSIPDLGSVSSTITVPDVGPVTSVRVKLNGTHTNVGDLVATLTDPEATTRTLFSRICGTADNFNLYLGEPSIDPLACPATDASVLRTPAQSFSAFDDHEAGGNWTLTLSDQHSSVAGTLAGWSLEICSICGNGVLDFGEICDDGNQLDGDCCSSDCLTAKAEGESCEDGNQCTLQETCVSGECVPGADLTCDPCLVCDSDEGCVVPHLVYPCQTPPAGGSVIKMLRDAGDGGRDSVTWRWRSQTPVELDEFGAPDVLTDISLCVYEGDNLVLSSTIPAAEECSGTPCWRRRDHDARFRDHLAQFGGLSTIRIKEGGTGRIILKGQGEGLELPSLALPPPLTVRMRRNDGTPCWESTYAEAASSSPTFFKARSN